MQCRMMAYSATVESVLLSALACWLEIHACTYCTEVHPTAPSSSFFLRRESATDCEFLSCVGCRPSKSNLIQQSSPFLYDVLCTAEDLINDPSDGLKMT